MPYSLLISLTDLPCSLSSNIYRLNSFVYRFRFITIIPVLLYNLLYFYPYSLSQILYQIQVVFNDAKEDAENSIVPPEVEFMY